MNYDDHDKRADRLSIAAGCDAIIAGAGNRDHVKPGTWWRNTLDGERRQVLEVHAHGVQLACNSCGTGELVRWSRFLPRFEPADCPPPAVPSAWYSPVTNELWVVEAVVSRGPILSKGPGLFELKCVPWADWSHWKSAAIATVDETPLPPPEIGSTWRWEGVGRLYAVEAVTSRGPILSCDSELVRVPWSAWVSWKPTGLTIDDLPPQET